MILIVYKVWIYFPSLNNNISNYYNNYRTRDIKVFCFISADVFVFRRSKVQFDGCHFETNDYFVLTFCHDMHYGNLRQVDKSCMLSFMTIYFSSIELRMFSVKINTDRDMEK